MKSNISISNHAIERAIYRNIIRGNRKSHFINGLKDLYKRSMEIVKLDNTNDPEELNKSYFLADQCFILVIKDNTLLTIICEDQWRKKYKWKPLELFSKEIT